MNLSPLQTKILAVAATLLGMLIKQYASHGYIDPMELAQWVSANFDILIGGFAIGAVTVPRKEELIARQG